MWYKDKKKLNLRENVKIIQRKDVVPCNECDCISKQKQKLREHMKDVHENVSMNRLHLLFKVLCLNDCLIALHKEKFNVHGQF